MSGIVDMLSPGCVWKQRRGRCACVRILAVDPRIAEHNLGYGNLLRNEPFVAWVEIQKIKYEGEREILVGEPWRTTGSNMLSAFRPVDRKVAA